MIALRPLEKNQVKTIIPLMVDFYAIDKYHIDPSASEKLFEAFLDDQNLGKAWLIYNEETVVGYAILTFVFSFEYGGKIAFIDELYLTENARGKGIGKKALELLTDRARESNVKLLYLELENHNEKAQKLYLAGGFVPHNRKLLKLKL